MDERRAKRLEVLQQAFMGPESLGTAKQVVAKFRAVVVDGQPTEEEYAELAENIAFLLMLSCNAAKGAVEFATVTSAIIGRAAGRAESREKAADALGEILKRSDN